MTYLLAIPLAILLLLAPISTQAQMACGEREVVIAKLDEKYGETRRSFGLAGPTAIFEVWASNKPPYTWTILKTTPNGWTCVMAVGDGWQTFTPDFATPTHFTQP